MQKLIITIFISLIANNFIYSQSMQIDSMKKSMYKAGKELVAFNKIHSTGVAIEFIGLGVGVIGAVTSSSNGSYGVPIVGGVIGIAGFLIELTAYKHIKNAGIILEGNGIAIPLRHRKSLQKSFGN